MTPPAGSRSKRLAFRLVGGALGVVAAVALLAFLGVVGVILWAVNVSLPAHQRELAETEKEFSRRAASQTQQALAKAAADGQLTDNEIQAAVERVWDVQRTDRVWVLRAQFTGTERLCFSYHITFSPGREPDIVSTELPVCPEFSHVR